jgi:hypothetical protein
MGMAFPRPSARLVHVLDLAALLWVAGWIVLALFVAREVRALRELSDTVVTAGVAVEDTGRLLGSLQDVPFVGDRVGEAAASVREAGESAQVSGRDSRETTENLSVLLALAIGLIPTLPLLGLYVPLRLTWMRESRAIRRSLASAPEDRVRDEYLARRAIGNLSYLDLQAASKDPFRDLDEGRFKALADLELARLGLRRQARLSQNGRGNAARRVERPPPSLR